MKKLVLMILLFSLTAVFVSCGDEGWKGLYDEDLSKYLKLGEYSGLTYEKADITVSDSEIEERINVILEASAEMIETDKEFAHSMTVSLDRYCFIDGVAEPSYSEEGGTYIYDEEKYDDEIINLLLPEMVGMKKGDVKEITVALSNGVTAKFRVTVRAVYERVVPTLNDSTAALLLSGCNSVEELRSAIKARIEEEKRSENKIETVSALRKKIINGSTVISLPYSLYNDYCEDRLHLYEKMAETAGLTLEKYVELSMGMKMSEFENMISDGASADVKDILVLYSIVKKENITSTDAEITEYCERMALESQGVFSSGEEYMSYYGKNAIKDEYLWYKVMEIVLERAKAV